MAGDAALYSRILGAALDDRADGLGAQAAPWLAGLIERRWNRRIPVCNPRQRDPYQLSGPPIVLYFTVTYGILLILRRLATRSGAVAWCWLLRERLPA